MDPNRKPLTPSEEVLVSKPGKLVGTVSRTDHPEPLRDVMGPEFMTYIGFTWGPSGEFFRMILMLPVNRHSLPDPTRHPSHYTSEPSYYDSATVVTHTHHNRHLLKRRRIK